MTLRPQYLPFRHRARRHLPAFTLIEVLIAVAIFSIVLAAINGVFYSALRLRNRGTAAVADLSPVAHAVSVMKRDLLAAIPSGSVLSGAMTTSPQTMGVGQAGSVLEFFTASGLISDDGPWGDAQKVDYYLRVPDVRTGATTGRDLIRAVTRNLLAPNQLPPEEQVVLENVEQMQFGFYDGSQWRQVWDGSSTTSSASSSGTSASGAASTSTNAASGVLPTAVEVSLVLASTDGKPRNPVRFIVPITIQPLAGSTSTETNAP